MTLPRILVPLDGSPQAEEALSYAVALAAGLGGELVLLHVVRGEAAHAPVVSRDEFYVQIEPRDYLAHLAQRLHASRPVSWGVTAGEPIAEILRWVETGRATMILMATHGWRERAGEPVGSIASRVAAFSPVPVLLVRFPAERPAAGPQPSLRVGEGEAPRTGALED